MSRPAPATAPTDLSHPPRPGSPRVRPFLRRIRPWTATLARLVLAGVFAAAGLSKLPDPAESVRAVRAYRILPENLVPAVGHALPLLEVAIAILLVVGLAVRMAAVLSAVLLAAFVIGIASAAARGLSIDCGCFGGGGEVAPGDTRYTAEIVRDLVLLAVALLLAHRPASRFALDGGGRSGPPGPLSTPAPTTGTGDHR